MQTRQFGRAHRATSIIGQGTWYIANGDRRSAVEALQRGLDSGMTHVDTAEMYSGAEELIGEALADRRDEIFLVSKVVPSNASRAGVRAACERSLRKLKTDRLDCYLLHWPGSYPLDETVAGFGDLQREGKILSWGVSNFDVDDLEEILPLAGEGGLACNQVLYHLQERAIEHAVIPWCERNGVAVVAYSPFGHDDFPDAHSAGGKVLADIAAKRGATPRQVALAFVTRLPPMLAIPKAGRPGHALDNAAAGDLVLTADEIAQLDRVFPPGPKPRGLPML
jgi:diketogulonate reductase-like aldo/keto reductase